MLGAEGGVGSGTRRHLSGQGTSCAHRRRANHPRLGAYVCGTPTKLVPRPGQRRPRVRPRQAPHLAPVRWLTVPRRGHHEKIAGIVTVAGTSTRGRSRGTSPGAVACTRTRPSSSTSAGSSSARPRALQTRAAQPIGRRIPLAVPGTRHMCTRAAAAAFQHRATVRTVAHNALAARHRLANSLCRVARRVGRVHVTVLCRRRLLTSVAAATARRATAAGFV